MEPLSTYVTKVMLFHGHIFVILGKIFNCTLIVLTIIKILSRATKFEMP